MKKKEISRKEAYLSPSNKDKRIPPSNDTEKKKQKGSSVYRTCFTLCTQDNINVEKCNVHLAFLFLPVSRIEVGGGATYISKFTKLRKCDMGKNQSD